MTLAQVGITLTFVAAALVAGIARRQGYTILGTVWAFVVAWGIEMVGMMAWVGATRRYPGLPEDWAGFAGVVALAVLIGIAAANQKSRG